MKTYMDYADIERKTITILHLKRNVGWLGDINSRKSRSQAASILYLYRETN